MTVDKIDEPNWPPKDGTQDGDGVWNEGKWAPAPSARLPEFYSRKGDIDRYREMLDLLVDIVAVPEGDIFPIAKFRNLAQDILGRLKKQGIPLGPDVRAAERKTELEALAFAYGVLHHVGAPGTRDHRAATITLEALKAWERAHPPAPLDPLLL